MLTDLSLRQMNSLPIIPKLDFSKIVLPKQYYEEIGLPNKPFYLMPFTLEFPITDLQEIITTIHDFTNSNEELRSTFDTRRKSWTIEYGNDPMVRIMNAINLPIENKEIQKRMIKTQQWLVFFAMRQEEEKRKKPLLVDSDDDSADELHLKWTKFIINLYYNEDKNTVIVEFHCPFRETDDESYHSFRREFSSILESKFQKK